MRTISEDERRARLVHRHRLDGSASGPEDVVASLLALHGTDPASVHLSVLARSRTSTLADVSAALDDRRTLVRWMAMRRTVFVVARADVPLIQAAVSAELASALRRALLSRIARNGIDPPIDADASRWLTDLEDRVEAALRAGPATGQELRAREPDLRAVLRAGAPSQVPQALTSPLLTVMSTAGRMVRGASVGSWTTRNQRWEHVDAWWPGGVPGIDPAEARSELARRWLERFGPATVEDLEWWTGWNKTDTSGALSRLDLEGVDLHGRPGVDLSGSEPDLRRQPEAVAALLPALDPTPMGWKHRGWFTAADPALLFDRAGNIGPTLWWNGELVGGWASTAHGIRLGITVDRGRDAVSGLEAAAGELEARLCGQVVTPAVATPLERRLADG